jgi:hypothetical protein
MKLNLCRTMQTSMQPKKITSNSKRDNKCEIVEAKAVSDGSEFHSEMVLGKNEWRYL